MPDAGRLCHAFVQALPARPPDLDPIELATPLVAAVAAARLAWPGVVVDDERFVAFVAARVVLASGTTTAAAVELAAALARLRTADLWLACACGDGDAVAIAAFERAFGGDVDIALGALGAPAHVADEARQVVRTRLFVAAPGSEPVIARYGGRGDLRAWVRATTVRAAIDLLRLTRREVPSEDVALDEPIEVGDVELAALRARYGAEFKDAFGQAFLALPKRDRVLLRYRYVDDLDVDGIGAVYRVHRSTAARWLQRIRNELLEDTRARLAARLAVSTDELDSILRFIGSELDVSISSALRR
jgi:RNA polymerase sigma-70 factor (ECF subfamily)